MNTADDIALAGANRRFVKSECNAPMLVQTIQDLLAEAAREKKASVAASTTEPVIKLQMAGSSETVKPVAPAATVTVPADPKQNRAEILKDVLAQIGKIREHAMAYTKTPSPSPSGPENLEKLHAQVNLLDANAKRGGYLRVARVTKAFDALLAEIRANPSRLTPSVPETLVEAADALSIFLKLDGTGTDPIVPGKVLAIDDDPICNHAVVNSLKRANLQAASVEDPAEGLKLLESEVFDLVLLDINMPNINGFDVAERLRRLPNCKNTTVIFITAHSNFKNRTQGILAGGSDFITKPVSPLELALKVNIHLLKPRLHRPVVTQTEAKPPVPVAEIAKLMAALPVIETPVVETKAVETPVLPVVEVPVVEAKPVEEMEEASQTVFFERAATVEKPDEEILPLVTTNVVEKEIVGTSVVIPPSQPAVVENKAAPEVPLVTQPPEQKTTEVIRTNFFQTLARAAQGQPTVNLNSKTQKIPMKTDNNTFDKIAVEVTRIIFGDDNATEMNVRLVKIALERYHVHEMLSQAATEPGRLAA
jgi:CheY-like chemotaxis protein